MINLMNSLFVVVFVFLVFFILFFFLFFFYFYLFTFFFINKNKYQTVLRLLTPALYSINVIIPN